MLKQYKHPDERFLTTSSKIKAIVELLLRLLLLVVVVLLPTIVDLFGLGELYSKNIFPILAVLPNSLSSLVIPSITEILVVIGIPVLVGFLIYKFVQIVKHFKKYGSTAGIFNAIKKITSLIIIVTITLTWFQLMHGINYRRDSIRSHMKLKSADEEFEIYYNALTWAYNGMISARGQLGEDYNGVAHPQTNFDTMAFDANNLMEAFSEEYGLNMSINLIKPKAVSLSHYWSYFYISGMYDPFIGEANINTDYLDILDIGKTICHEVAHCKGYASETEANTAAVLACIHSDRADFRYAGYYAIFRNLYGVVYEYANNTGNASRMEYFTMYPEFEAVRRDISASEAYFKTLEEGLIPDMLEFISDTVNNTFLKMNGQTGGQATYHVPSNTYVDFYYTYIMERDNADS